MCQVLELQYTCRAHCKGLSYTQETCRAHCKGLLRTQERNKSSTKVTGISVGYCMSDFKGQTIEPTNEVDKAEIEWKQKLPREQRIQSHDAY